MTREVSVGNASGQKKKQEREEGVLAGSVEKKHDGQHQIDKKAQYAKAGAWGKRVWKGRGPGREIGEKRGLTKRGSKKLKVYSGFSRDRGKKGHGWRGNTVKKNGWSPKKKRGRVENGGMQRDKVIT